MIRSAPVDSGSRPDSWMDLLSVREVHWPKRPRATAVDQRSPAQYGQYSAPTYSTCGLPSRVAAGASLTRFGPFVIWSLTPAAAKAR